MQTTSVRLPADLHERLRVLGRRDLRSKNAVMIVALYRGLAILEAQAPPVPPMDLDASDLPDAGSDGGDTGLFHGLPTGEACG